MASLTVAIPTFNMAGHLERALNALVQSGLYAHLEQIVLVDDGSTDGTFEVVSEWKKKSDRRQILLYYSLGQNRGRLATRWEAAKLARSSHILFLDARVELGEGFTRELLELLKSHNNLQPTVRIDPTKSLFHLYWLRTHERIFARTFREEENGILLTTENYERYAKGTTALVCRKDHFLKACESLPPAIKYSDDTALLYEICRQEPLLRTSRLYILWEPRQNWRAFLKHMFIDRGLAFADYHVFSKWTVLTAAYFLGLVSLLGLLSLFFVDLQSGLVGAAVIVGGGLLSTALFARGPMEFLRLAPLHFAVLTVYATGILRGIAYVGFRRLSYSLRQASRKGA